MQLRSDETWHRLVSWTYDQSASERLSAQVIYDAGYTNVNPIHPLGGPDGGKDAIAERHGESWIMAAYFPFGLQAFAEIKAKFLSDAAGVTRNNAVGIAFVTNQRMSNAERADLSASVSCRSDLFHLERVTACLDRPHMRSVRLQYLGFDYADQNDDGKPDHDGLVEALLRGLPVRRAQRLRAAGVTSTQLPDVVDWMAQQRQPESFGELSPGTVTVLVGPMGAGKTEVAHDWLADRAQDATKSQRAPIPLWLPARELAAGVEPAIVARVGWSIVKTCGCAIVIDGIDQLDPIEAATLLDSAEIFCSEWPASIVLATGKPDGAPSHRQIAIAPWETDRGHRLAELVAGERLPYAIWSDELTKALSSPLLAIAIGVRSAGSQQLPPSRASLIATLADQSIRQARASITTELTRALTRLAVHSIDTGEGLATSSFDDDTRNALARLPIIVDQDGILSFALPLLEQTYGARAIREGIATVESAASAERFPRWRFTLVLALDIDDPVASDLFFERIVSVNPAAASWLLRELDVRQEMTLESTTANRPPSHDLVIDEASGPLLPAVGQASIPLRDAYLTWIDGLGHLGASLGRSNGVHPSAWDVNVDHNHLILGWRTVADGTDLAPTNVGAGLAEVYGSGVRPIWSPVTSMALPHGVLARWSWSRNFLRGALEKRLRSYALDCDPQGLLAREREWQLGQVIHFGGKRWDHRAIPVDELRAKIGKQLANTQTAVRATWSYSTGSYDRDALLWLAARLPESGELVRPVVTPDRLGGGYVWSAYTPDQYHRLLVQVLEGAIDGYTDLISRNFPNFGRALGVAALAPLRIVGQLYVPTDDRAGAASSRESPTLLYSLGHAGRSRVDEPRVDISLDTDPHAPPRGAVRELAEARPTRSSPFARPGYTMAAVHIEGPRPASDWAYQWLIDDLFAVGWVERSWQPPL